MKSILLSFLFFISLGIHAQVITAGVIELPDLQVLYRGIDNKVNVSIVNLQSEKISVVGQSVQLTSVENGVYTARPIGRSTNAVIIVRTVSEDTTIEIGRRYFKVLNLPEPMLYYGDKTNGTYVDNESRTLKAAYPKEIPIEANFEIIRWTLYCGTEEISGTGSDLSEADAFLKSVNPKSVLSIKTTVLGPDGIQRSVSGCWFVN